MNIVYDIPKLNRILTDLSVLTDIRISFCDPEGKTIINTAPKDDYCSHLQQNKENLKKCRQSDAEILNKCKHSKKVEKHICFAGLCDLAMPIIKQDAVAGYVLMGRICTPDTVKIPDVPMFSNRKLESFTDLLPQILFESAIEIKQDSLTEKAIKFIDDNIASELSVNVICNHLHISKNCLYGMFHEDCGCTVNEYISKKRLERAKTFLSTTDYTVSEISQLVGINNYTYFCKLFKKKEGISPLEYRKNHIDKYTNIKYN